MANFYTEVPELKYHLNNSMMERICELKERGYQDKDKYDYAPQDYADAMDSFDKVLEITGEITGEIIAPNAEGVDEEGKMTHPQILQSVRYDIDKEAIRAFEAIADVYRWSPGYQDGEAKRVKFTIPLYFRIPK